MVSYAGLTSVELGQTNKSGTLSNVMLVPVFTTSLIFFHTGYCCEVAQKFILLIIVDGQLYLYFFHLLKS